jgi:CRISPR system Cascade subunit CasD
MQVLTFQICAPLCSWGGDGGIGEVRETWRAPPHSALVGLLGAALGLDRQDQTGLAAVRDGFLFALRLDVPGDLLRDYHTTQTVAAPDRKRLGKDKHGLTRGQLMRSGPHVTVLSERHYLSDFAALVVVLPRPAAPFSLEELAGALKKPVFPIYFGRRTCAPCEPLHPQLREVPTVADALRTSDHPGLRLFRETMCAADTPQVRWDARISRGASGLEAEQTHSVRSQPLRRDRWQFDILQTNIGHLDLAVSHEGA